MDLKKIEKFIDKQKVSFICSVDNENYPNVKAMLNRLNNLPPPDYYIILQKIVKFNKTDFFTINLIIKLILQLHETKIIIVSNLLVAHGRCSDGTHSARYSSRSGNR